MALMNQLLTAETLAKMSDSQKEYVVQRIDNILNDKEVQSLIATKINPEISLVSKDVSLAEGIKMVRVTD